MKICPVRTEFLHADGRMGRQTSMTQLKVVFHRFSQFFESAWKGITGGGRNLYVYVEDEFLWISVPLIYVLHLLTALRNTERLSRVCVCAWTTKSPMTSTNKVKHSDNNNFIHCGCVPGIHDDFALASLCTPGLSGTHSTSSKTTVSNTTVK